MLWALAILIFTILSISSTQDTVNIYRLHDDGTKDLIHPLRYPSERHVCRKTISYNLTSGEYCEFIPSYDQQYKLLENANAYSSMYAGLKATWDAYFRSFIGRSVASYVLSREFTVQELETMKQSMHLWWFYHDSLLLSHQINLKTPFEKTFFGVLPKHKNHFNRKGVRSWAGYTFTLENQGSFQIKDVIHSARHNDACGLSKLQFMTIKYTQDECTNPVHGTMIPGTSLYFDLSVFTVGAFTLLKNPSVGNMTFETSLPGYPNCILRYKIKAKILENTNKYYLDSAEYIHL